VRPTDFPLRSIESRAAARAMLKRKFMQVPKFQWFFCPDEPEDSLPTYEDLATDEELLSCVGTASHVMLMPETYEFDSGSWPTKQELLQGWQARSNDTERWERRWKDKGRYYLCFRPGCAIVSVLTKTSEAYRRIMGQTG
jgi:hypothetical protein